MVVMAAMETMGMQVIMDLTTILITTVTTVTLTRIAEETKEVDIRLETIIEEMLLVLEIQTRQEEMPLLLEKTPMLEILEMLTREKALLTVITATQER